MDILIPILIIGGALVLFIVTFLINRKIKVPEGTKYDDLPEKCLKCHNEICKNKAQEEVSKRKKEKIDMTPDELIEFLECEDEKNESQ